MINKLLCFMWGHQTELLVWYRYFKNFKSGHVVYKSSNCIHCGKIK